MLALEGRLDGMVDGTDEPADRECLDAAQLCFVKQHYTTAARLHAEALAVTPKLAEDLRAGHRFNAARAAALAASGRGDDVAGLGEPDRQRLRNQAQEWLRLELAACSERVENGTAADRIQAQKTLLLWREDPDLNSLRDFEALEKLPPAERQDWRRLWEEVAELLRRAKTTR